MESGLSEGAGDGQRPTALLIAGPTASGKSAFAVRLARATGGVVVNADSMQVYRDLAVLSARPDEAEQGGVAHDLFGFVDGAHEFSVGAYGRAVASLPAAPMRIFVGGTGLYFRALTEGLVETPPVPDDLVAGIAARAGAGEDLHAALAGLDPRGAARIARADAARISRALAVVIATGRSLADWQDEAQSPPLLSAGSWRGIYLAPPRDALHARIDRRFVGMIARGALDEVRALAARGLPVNRGVMKAHGVPHLARHLRGELSLDEAISLGQLDTRRYAKRQMTWARRFMRDWSWFEEPESAAAATLQGLA